MDKKTIYDRCRDEADSLLEKYFPNYLYDATVRKPQVLEPEYNDDLPHKVELEFGKWLSALWKELNPSSHKSYEEIMNQHLNMTMTDAEYRPHLRDAKTEAEKVTLWEKITKSNHEDVAYYKGLLMEYTRSLLNISIEDFMEDL